MLNAQNGHFGTRAHTLNAAAPCQLLAAAPRYAHLQRCNHASDPAYTLAGYFNLLGQAALTAGVEFSLASFIASVIQMCSGADDGGAIILTNTQLLALYAAVLVVHGLINSMSVDLLGWINSVSAWWHLVGTIAIIIIM